jgi:malate/lactate dehydrogenase
MKKNGRSHAAKMQTMVMAMALLVFAPWMTANAAPDDTAKPQACSADIATFCKDVQSGGGRIVKCLNEHSSKLSPACKTYMEEGAKKRKEAQDVCKNDLDRFCKDVKPGGGRIVKCMKAHQNELSPECKEKMSQAK